MKTFKIIFIALFLTSYISAQWELQNPLTPELNYRSAYFLNERIGYIVGDSGVIVRTIDGGDNWIIDLNSTSEILNSTFFIDSLTGWICGYNGTILRTSNGGLNWEELNSDTNAILNSVYFDDYENGWIVGQHGEF